MATKARSKAKKTRVKKTRPGPGKRERKPAPRKKPGWLRRSLRLLLLLVGIGIGLGVPWIVWLDAQVRTEFDGRKWDLPSRVYARPLSLYTGKAISIRSLLLELKAVGYRQTRLATGTPDGDTGDLRR